MGTHLLRRSSRSLVSTPRSSPRAPCPAGRRGTTRRRTGRPLRPSSCRASMHRRRSSRAGGRGRSPAGHRRRARPSRAPRSRRPSPHAASSRSRPAARRPRRLPCSSSRRPRPCRTGRGCALPVDEEVALSRLRRRQHRRAAVRGRDRAPAAGGHERQSDCPHHDRVQRSHSEPSSCEMVSTSYGTSRESGLAGCNVEPPRPRTRPRFRGLRACRRCAKDHESRSGATSQPRAPRPSFAPASRSCTECARRQAVVMCVAALRPRAVTATAFAYSRNIEPSRSRVA